MSSRVAQLDFFRPTPWYHWIWVTGMVGTFTVGVFFREAVPYGMLGPLGDILYYMNYSQQNIVRGLLLVTAAVHIAGGLHAYILSRQMNLNGRSTFLWVAQSTYLGYSFLMPLKAKYRQVQKEE